VPGGRERRGFQSEPSKLRRGHEDERYAAPEPERRREASLRPRSAARHEFVLGFATTLPFAAAGIGLLVLTGWLCVELGTHVHNGLGVLIGTFAGIMVGIIAGLVPLCIKVILRRR